MSLYTVSFTTKKLITKYDAKGKIIGTTAHHMPVTVHGLPKITAETYSGCDNFKMTAEVPDTSRSSKSHKPRSTHAVEAPEKVDSSISRAARSGDLSAAISGGE